MMFVQEDQVFRKRFSQDASAAMTLLEVCLWSVGGRRGAVKVSTKIGASIKSGDDHHDDM